MRYADQLLDVAAAAHDRGIVHRDIKPENVLVVADGSVRLIDFGLAHVSEPRPCDGTEPVNAVGTPAFMPPEQAQKRLDLVGPRSDVWAIGATMFALLTGRTVHVKSTVSELVAAAANEPAPPLASVAQDVPFELAAVVDKALSLSPDNRFGSAGAMRAALREAYRGMFGEVLPAPAAPRLRTGLVSVPPMAWKPASRGKHALPKRVAALAVAAVVSAVALTVAASVMPSRAWPTGRAARAKTSGVCADGGGFTQAAADDSQVGSSSRRREARL